MLEMDLSTIIVRALDSHPKVVPHTWSTRILHQAYLSLPNHETLFRVCHVRIHVCFLLLIISLIPLAFTFYCEVDVDGLGLFNQ